MAMAYRRWRPRHVYDSEEDIYNADVSQLGSGPYDSMEQPGHHLESVATEGLSIDECIQRTLPIVELLLTENRTTQDGVRDNVQLYSSLHENQLEQQQKLQEKYMVTKAYAQDLQKRSREDLELIENLRTQLKEYKKASPATSENTAEIAGKLQQETLRAKQLEADLASTRQEAARTAADLANQRLENQQINDDYEKTIQEQKTQIRELQKQLEVMKEAATKQAPETAAQLRPTSSGEQHEDEEPQNTDSAATSDSSRKDELETLRGKGLVRAFSQLKSPENKPKVPVKRVSLTSPDAVQQGVDYKTRCEQLEAKLALHDREYKQHVHEINHLQVTLTSLTSDLEMEKANNQHKSERLGEMKANFELFCTEYNELLEKYQELCVQQPSTSPGIQAEVRERMDFMMAQIIEAEEMIQDRDNKIAQLTNEIQMMDLNSQRQEGEIDDYIKQLEEEQAKLRACEEAKATLEAQLEQS